MTAIRVEILAAALQVSIVAVRKQFAVGKLPAPDATETARRTRGTPTAMAWRLDTLQRWNPSVAARCTAIQQALADHPLTAAVTPKRRGGNAQTDWRLSGMATL